MYPIRRILLFVFASPPNQQVLHGIQVTIRGKNGPQFNSWNCRQADDLRLSVRPPYTLSHVDVIVENYNNNIIIQTRNNTSIGTISSCFHSLSTNIPKWNKDRPFERSVLFQLQRVSQYRVYRDRLVPCRWLCGTLFYYVCGYILTWQCT